ncbi:hypothetical protein AB0J43_00630, partial [Nonomuraea fuscirosea]
GLLVQGAVVEQAQGVVVVGHGPGGAAEKGFLVVEVPGGRAYAVVEEADLLAEAEERELVGREVRVAIDGKVNVASW